MATRHRSRELVLQMAYQWSLNDADQALRPSIEAFWNKQKNANDENKDFFMRLACGVADHTPELDKLIVKYLDNWKFERVQKVELAIMRLAIFELLFDSSDDKPDAAVVINEAIELSKKFASGDSSQFVNGILDKIAKNETPR